MEKIIKTALIITLSVGIVTSAVANDNKKDKTNDKSIESLQYEVKSLPESKKIVMGVKSLERGDIQVKIFDAQGNKVYAEKQENTEGFIRVYDMSALDSDKYTLQLTDNTTSQKTSVDFRPANTGKSNFVAYFPSSFDKSLQVSYANATGVVNLAISRTNGEKVFEKAIDAKSADSFIANLAALNKGLYTLEISNNGQSFSKEISLK